MTHKEVRKYTIVVAAKDDQAFDEALLEATHRMNTGSLSGKDSNEDGAFYFDSTTDVPEGELPA